MKLNEYTIIGIIISFFLLVGGVIGYTVRAISTRDRYIWATAERYYAEKSYYDAQFAAIMKEGQTHE